MKRTIIIDVSYNDFTQYLKEKGKITDEVLCSVKCKEGVFKMTFEGGNHFITIEPQTAMQKLLAESVKDFFERVDMPKRAWNHMNYKLADIFSEKYQQHPKMVGLEDYQKRSVIKELVTVEDLLSIPRSKLKTWRNLGNKTLLEIVNALKDEGVENIYPFMLDE